MPFPCSLGILMIFILCLEVSIWIMVDLKLREHVFILLSSGQPQPQFQPNIFSSRAFRSSNYDCNPNPNPSSNPNLNSNSNPNPRTFFGLINS